MEKLIKLVLIGMLSQATFFMDIALCPAWEAGQKEEVRQPQSTLAVIKRKTLKGLSTDKQLFRITESTGYYDIQGRETTIHDLPVPCQAQIYYVPVRHADPQALKIVIKKILPGAKKDFPPPKPE